MRKLSKSTAITLSIIICVFLVIGFVLSFIPMTFGSKTFVSFLGSVNVSSDLAGGMYGEYDITTENPTETELFNSMSRLKEVFEKDGYKNVNIYTVKNSDETQKLRVEVSYPRGSKTFSEVYSSLSLVSSGKFVLNTASTIGGDDDVVVDGGVCVKEVKVYTNNHTNYISVIFNDYGKEQYEKLCKATSSIYLHLGTYNQSISASNITDYSAFTLSDSDYKNLTALQKRVVIGCMSIEVNSSTATINTMSSNIAGLGSSSSAEDKGFMSSSVLILALSALAIVVVAVLAAFALRFGLFAVVVAISMLFNSYLLLIGLNLMPSVEIGLSSIFALILGLIVIYVYTFIYASKVKSEYEIGKSFIASLDSAYKNTFASSLICNLALFLSALILVGFSFGQVSSAMVVFAICSFLAIITNVAVIPFLVKVGISFDKIDMKLFMLKKRSIGFKAENENVEDLEKEDK